MKPCSRSGLGGGGAGARGGQLIKIYKDSILRLLCKFLNFSYSLNKQKREIPVDAFLVNSGTNYISNSRKCIYQFSSVAQSCPTL